MIPGVDTSTDVHLLILLYAPERGICMTDLATLMDVDGTTVWRHVKRLKAARLVKVSYAGEYAIPTATPKGRAATLALPRRVAAQLPDE